MDSVRFGRALGIGTRLAAKTVRSALEAAAAPSPSAATGASSAASPAATPANVVEQSGGWTAPEALPVVKRVVKAKTRVRQARKGLKHEGKRFGEAVWGPFARLGGVLWLEVTGVFFGLMALSAGLGAWKMRDALQVTAVNHQDHMRLLVAIGVTVVFGYFCLSSFVRAGRRGRRR